MSFSTLLRVLPRAIISLQATPALTRPASVLFNQRETTFLAVNRRELSTEDQSDNSNQAAPTEGELKLAKLLLARFPKSNKIDVKDVSGGCGSMYIVMVETVEFKGMRTIKQHQLVNETLRDEIKNNMHGLRVFTAVPPS